MELAENRAIQFKKELAELLKKWNTELEMVEISRGYGGSEYSMQIDIPAVYDEECNCIAEWTEIDLGSYVDGNL